MSNKIILKRSVTASKVPLLSDLEYGELALNYYDGKLYYKRSDGVLPANDTIKSIDGGGTAITDPTAPVSPVDGTLWWNSTTKTLRVYYDNGVTPVWEDATDTNLVSNDITTALGFTPYNSTNPSGYTSNTGTVTSVSLTVPTGLSISGGPITSSGTLALTLAAGYSIPTTANQTNWNTAFTDRNKWDGGATGLVAATGRTSLGATTLGSNLFTAANPTAITFIRVNADNTISTLDANTFRAAIGAGTSSTVGTVTSVSGAGTAAGLTLTGTVSSSGSLTLGGTLSTPVSTINDSTTVGRNLVKLVDPTAVTFLRVNADNTVSALDAASFRAAIGAGSSSSTGTVTSVSGIGTVSGLTLSDRKSTRLNSSH